MKPSNPFRERGNFELQNHMKIPNEGNLTPFRLHADLIVVSIPFNCNFNLTGSDF